MNPESEYRKIAAKVDSGERITAAEALRLWDAPLALLGKLAFDIKRRKSGEEVYYNRNFHIEPTNICILECEFCSYRRAEGAPGAWNHSLDEIGRIARGFAGSGVTEAHIVGGVHPRHTLDTYVEIIRRVKDELPGISVKAYTAVELGHMIRKAGLPIAEGLRMLKEAGLDAIPGGGAEIFHPAIRRRLCPKKGSAEEWLEVHRAAHRLGIPTNATMLYGHIEDVSHRVDHMERLRRLQDETGGFDAFIPLKYRSAGNNLAAATAAGETPVADDLRTLAMARIFLDNFAHVKAYWPMYGKVTAEMALAFGADDVDGTINDTTRIYSMAGARDEHPVMTVGEIEAMAAAAGLRAVERDTFYSLLLAE